MAVDEIDPCGVYFGATGWQVYASANSGDSWMTIVRDLPPSAVCRGASTTMIRVVLPLQLCGLANVSREIELEVEDTASISTGLDGLEIRHPMLRGTIRDQLPLQRRPFIWFFAYGEDFIVTSTNQLVTRECGNRQTAAQDCRFYGWRLRFANASSNFWISSTVPQIAGTAHPKPGAWL